MKGKKKWLMLAAALLGAAISVVQPELVPLVPVLQNLLVGEAPAVE